MDKQITLGLMLVAVAAIGATGLITASANADRTLTCDTSKDCNVIIHKLKVGDDLIIQFKASPPSGGGGGGGTTSTVDQQARDDISGLKSVDVTQDNELNRLSTEHTGIMTNFSALNDKVTAQANEIEMLKAQIANISAVNPIVDVNVTHPGENVTQPPVVTPPVENNTTPVPPVENNTTPIPPVGGNETGTGNETTTTPPIDNGTVVVPPTNGTVITPPGNETVIVPPSNGTVIVPPENSTITPPGNVTNAGNETIGFQPAPNSTEPVVNPLQ